MSVPGPASSTDVLLVHYACRVKDAREFGGEWSEGGVPGQGSLLHEIGDKVGAHTFAQIVRSSSIHVSSPCCAPSLRPSVLPGGHEVPASAGPVCLHFRRSR